MKIFLALALAFSLISATADAADPDANAIIRSLAPITYLPEHGGKPRRAIDLEVRFQTGSAKLTPSAKTLLSRLATALKSDALSSSRFEIVGHTDASGSASSNQKLSERRAKSVVEYLAAAHGIAKSRLSAIGRGEEQLKDVLIPNSAANRRVEIINLAPIQTPTGARDTDPSAKANSILMGK